MSRGRRQRVLTRVHEEENSKFTINRILPDGLYELFTRPAPAIRLAELMQDESGLADRHIAWLNTLQRSMFSDEDWEELTLYTWLAFRDSFRTYRAAILRNIEEAK